MKVKKTKSQHTMFGLWKLMGFVVAMSTLPIHSYAVDHKDEEHYYEIASGRLGQALSIFAMQAGVGLTFDSTLTSHLNTQGLKGYYSIEGGFKKLLQDTPLHVTKGVEDSWVIRQDAPGSLVSQQQMGSESQSYSVLEPIVIQAYQKQADKKSKYSAFRGNMDILRSKEDIQAYTLIDQKKIANTGAVSVKDLLHKTLLSNSSLSNTDGRGFMGDANQFNLHGLGINQTLVLVNGRRSAGVGYRGASELGDQSNVNNIPLALIERIEILPSSSAATIYGGNAFGGVINIVLKHDYVGSEINFGYENTFQSDTAIKTANFITGPEIDEQTHLLISGQKSGFNELTAADRNFNQKYRDIVLQNNPNAIYGMNRDGKTTIVPPYGNLVNIRTVDGSALLPQYGDASFAYLPKGYSGFQTDGFEPLKKTLGQYQLDLYDGVSGFSSASSLVAANKTESFYVALNHDFNEQLNLYAESGYNQSELKVATTYYDRLEPVILEADAASNPFNKDIMITFPVQWADAPQRYRYIYNRNKIALLGLTYKPNKDWTINADYTWSSSLIDLAHSRVFNYSAYMDDYKSGQLDLLRDTTSFNTSIKDYWQVSRTYTKQNVQDLNLRSSGKLTSWNADDIQLVFGMQYHDMHGEGIPEYAKNPAVDVHRQNSLSTYADVTLPIISPEQDLFWAKKLDFHLAGRYEYFNIITLNKAFSTLTPTVGFRFIPNNTFMFRASYSQGKQYPSISQLQPNSLSSYTSSVIDPATGIAIDVLTNGGGNPDLKPESIKSLNLGVVFSPEMFSDLKATVNFYKIEKRNNIISLGENGILNRADMLPDKIGRDSEGNILSVDATPFNGLSLKNSGLDLGISYFIPSILNGLNLSVDYSHIYNYKQKIGTAQNYVETNSYPDGLLKNKAALSTYLQANEKLGVGWNVYYYGRYQLSAMVPSIVKAQGSDSVAAQSYHDIFARYQLASSLASKYGYPELTLGIKNLFNTYQIDMSKDHIGGNNNPYLRQYYINLKFKF